MPNPIVSHQAPGLFLKTRFPKWIDGTAVCLGAMIPDLDFLLFFAYLPFPFRHLSHSLLGLLIWVTPITILMNIAFSKYIGPWISEIARKKGIISRILTYFGFDELYHLKKKQFDKRFYIVAFYSALIGGLTHLLIDLPAHGLIELFFPWALFLVPEFLRVPVLELHRIIPLYELLWFLEDFILLGISLIFLRKIKRAGLIEKWHGSVNLSY